MAYEGTSIEGVGSEPFYTLDGGVEKWAPMNQGVTPMFFMEPVQNAIKTAEAGRPIFDEVETVRIFLAGDPGTQICSPVTDHYRERFSDAYEAWKKKNDGKEFISGTPLRAWTAVTSAQVAEFEALKIFNVEGLASLPEHAMQKYSGNNLREWKAKAQAWLDNAKGGASAMQLAEENLRMKDDLADLRKTVTDLKAAMKAADRRRKPHDEEEAA